MEEKTKRLLYKNGGRNTHTITHCRLYNENKLSFDVIYLLFQRLMCKDNKILCIEQGFSELIFQEQQQ